jgi:hypothetical protein
VTGIRQRAQTMANSYTPKLFCNVGTTMHNADDIHHFFFSVQNLCVGIAPLVTDKRVFFGVCYGCCFGVSSQYGVHLFIRHRGILFHNLADPELVANFLA